MPLTFLLVSVPVSIAAFLIVFAIAFLHELFVVELHKSSAEPCYPTSGIAVGPWFLMPRKKACFKRPAATYLANT